MGQNGAECMPRYRVPRLAWFSRGKLKHVEMKLQVLVDQQYYLLPRSGYTSIHFLYFYKTTNLVDSLL